MYAIADEDEVYPFHTQRDTPGFNIAASLADLAAAAARVLGVICIVAGLLYAGWQQYSQ